MKHILYSILVLLFTSQTATAQKIRFSDTSNKWFHRASVVYPDGTHWYGYPRYIYGDTVQLNGHIYRAFSGGGDSALIREDTLANRVYALIIDHMYYGPDTTEFVLYDFNLQVGDTFKTRHTFMVVKKTDSTLINNVWHRVIDLGDTITGFQNYYTVIEGIGTTKTPLYPYHAYFFEHDVNLICFYNNGIKPTITPQVGYLFDNLNSCKLGINSSKLSSALKIYPQPAQDQLTIKLPHTSRDITLSVYDQLGRSILRQTYHDKDKIEVETSQFTPGVYYYWLSIDNEPVTGKLLVQH